MQEPSSTNPKTGHTYDFDIGVTIAFSCAASRHRGSGRLHRSELDAHTMHASDAKKDKATQRKKEIERKEAKANRKRAEVCRARAMCKPQMEKIKSSEGERLCHAANRMLLLFILGLICKAPILPNYAITGAAELAG